MQRGGERCETNLSRVQIEKWGTGTGGRHGTGTPDPTRDKTHLNGLWRGHCSSNDPSRNRQSLTRISAADNQRSAGSVLQHIVFCLFSHIMTIDNLTLRGSRMANDPWAGTFIRDCFIEKKNANSSLLGKQC